MWHFWRRVAEQMPLGGLPATAKEFWQWMVDYEDKHWGYTDGGRKVVDAFFEGWTKRWFLRPLHGFAHQILLALMEPRLRAILHLEPPRRRMMPLARTAARAYFRIVPFRVVRTDRSWVDYSGRRYGNVLDLERVGPQPA